MAEGHEPWRNRRMQTEGRTGGLQSNNSHVRSNLKVLKVNPTVCVCVCVRVLSHMCLTPICMALTMSCCCQEDHLAAAAATS